MGNRERKVKDLVEKIQRGELTPKEAKKILKERGLSSEPKSLKGQVAGYISYVAYIIFCFPLTITLAAQLQVISFPVLVIYISLIFLAIGTFFAVWVTYSHRKKGGLKGSDETIVFYRDGLYSIMRHPGVFGFMIWFIFLPIILSAIVPFTFISVVGIIIAVVFHYYMVYVEEKINIIKWGDEYIQYMKEVPRFNTIIVVGAIVVVAALWILDYFFF
jgi:protein-S-isoprenylcysteine O-methyltransferase Ste14